MPQDIEPTDDFTSMPWDRLSGTALLPHVAPLFERWALATTDLSGPNAQQLAQSKVKTVQSFFEFSGKPPARVTPDDVLAWQRALLSGDHAPMTVYQMISRLSSFYEWALSHPQVARVLRGNPVDQVRPRAPTLYRNARALSDDALERLLQAIRARISEGSLVARRDYALLLFYLFTGMSREEIIRLRWGDLTLQADGSLIFSTLARGGRRRARLVKDASLQEALLSYLAASGRLDEMQAESPLWARHDPGIKARYDAASARKPAKHAGNPDAPLTSKAFEKNIQAYAQGAGLGHIHIQQLRHTFARIVGEELPNLEEARQALGLADTLQTRRYLSRVAVESDLISRRIAARLGLDRRSSGSSEARRLRLLLDDEEPDS